MSSTSAVLIYEFDEETSTVLATTSSSPCQSRFEIFKDMGDVWLLFVSIVPSLTSLSRSTSVFVFGYGLAVALKVLFLVVYVFNSSFRVLLLDLNFPLLDLVIFSVALTATTQDTETATMRYSLSSSSSSTTATVNKSSKPIQPNSFRFKPLNTDSDNQCYFRHCYYYRYLRLCYPNCTRQFFLKNFSSCYLHVLANTGLDLIPSMLCAVIHTDFKPKSVWPFNDVCSFLFLLKEGEKRFSEKSFYVCRNWGRYALMMRL